jgi:uncharacterized protein YndB with AHSA1/START domain
MRKSQMDIHVGDTRVLAITRRIPAPSEAVFAAWTEAEQLRCWYAPRGMTVPQCEVELRPGGAIRLTMRDADGRDAPHPMAIEAVEPPRRLVLRVLDGMACDLAGTVGTILFEPDAAGTRLHVTWTHPTAEMRERHAAMGFTKAWGELLDKLTAHLASPPPGLCPMAAPLAPEHGWLHRLLGEWRYETECTDPDGTTMRAAGRESVRSLGGQWVIGEAEGTMPGVGAVRWVVTMGFDAKAGRFRGSWVGSMMAHMFLYDGALSEDGRTLTLENEGPSFDGQGTSRYRDIVELRDDDTRLLMSEVQGADGAWTRFMTGTFRRAG